MEPVAHMKSRIERMTPPVQLSFAARGPEDLRQASLRDVKRFEKRAGFEKCPAATTTTAKSGEGLRVMRGASSEPWYRGGTCFVAEAPSDIELNRLAVKSTELQLEPRGDGVWRMRFGNEWADFLAKPAAGGSWIARYVAGSFEIEKPAEFEALAASRIQAEMEVL